MSLDMRQQRIVILERWEMKGATPTIALSFQITTQRGITKAEPRRLLEWRRQNWYSRARHIEYMQQSTREEGAAKSPWVVSRIWSRHACEETTRGCWKNFLKGSEGTVPVLTRAKKNTYLFPAPYWIIYRVLGRILRTDFSRLWVIINPFLNTRSCLANLKAEP